MFQYLFRTALTPVVLALLLTLSAVADEPAKPESDGQKYLLRYKFSPGETLRWEVQHHATVDTTVSGTSQTAETTSFSVKTWKVKSVDEQGRITFEHMVESIDMRQKLSGRQEVQYNSLTDKTPPPGFEDAAKSVGVLLTTMTIEPSGHVYRRVDNHKSGKEQNEYITTPFPKESIAVGHVWSVDYHSTCQAKNGVARRIELQQKYVLEEVKSGVAVIRVSTLVLTPLGGDAAIEAQLVQSEVDGKIRFDIASGRILSQSSLVDKHVVNFQGNASTMHYAMKFTEQLKTGNSQTAARPRGPAGPAGPAAPSAMSPRPRMQR